MHRPLSMRKTGFEPWRLPPTRFPGVRLSRSATSPFQRNAEGVQKYRISQSDSKIPESRLAHWCNGAELFASQVAAHGVAEVVAFEALTEAVHELGEGRFSGHVPARDNATVAEHVRGSIPFGMQPMAALGHSDEAQTAVVGF